MFNIVLVCGGDYSARVDDDHHVGFWKRTLESHPGVRVIGWYPWSSWRQMPAEGVDLYFFLDFTYDIWNIAAFDKFKPRAMYWWDAFHLMFSLVAQIPLIFDKVYLAEFLDVQHLKLCGFNNVEWLPGAFHPDFYKPLAIEKEYDFGFVGQLDANVYRKTATRKQLITHLSHEFNGAVNTNLRGPAVNELYNKSRVLVERTIFCNIGTRLFETVGSGGFALINKFPCYNGLDMLGRDGVHFVTYDDSPEDAAEKIRYYLKHEDERNKIAKDGQEHFLNHHTYRHRVDRILKDFM